MSRRSIIHNTGDGFVVSEMLNEHVCRLLADVGIPEQVLKAMPYTIASAHEFEIASQIIAQVSIFSLMAKKTAPGQRWWSLMPIVSTEFKEEMRRVNRRLFADDWARLMPQHVRRLGPADL